MSKIERYQGNVQAFASNAVGLERTVFGGTEQANDLTSQVTSAFLRGWGVVGPSEHPSLEDFNAAMYAMSQFIAYQHQVGVPEWHTEQEYNTGSVCVRSGEAYISLSDSNVGSAPPSAKWTLALTAKNAAANITGFLKASNNLSEIAAAGAAAQLAARTSLGLGTAATRLVGTGATQVSDMSSFASGDGWMKFPNGKIIQYGYVPLGSTTHVDFPIPFPSKCSSIVCGGGHSNASAVAIQNFYNVTTSGFDVKNQTVLNNATAFYWQAIGE